jgi:hypothetical protein
MLKSIVKRYAFDLTANASYLALCTIKPLADLIHYKGFLFFYCRKSPMQYLGDFLFELWYGVCKGVARYPLQFNAPQVIFIRWAGLRAGAPER